MVFIIKIPNKNKIQSNEQSQSQAEGDLDRRIDTVETGQSQHQHQISQAEAEAHHHHHPPGQSDDKEGAAAQSLISGQHVPSQPEPEEYSCTYTAPAPVDIILAPACINHEFVRSNDKSLIVERPERLLASLLAVSNLWARCMVEAQDQEQNQTGEQQNGATQTVRLELDLPNRKESRSMAIRPNDSPFNLIKTTRSLSLNPPHPSVAFIHSNPDEQFEMPDSTLYQLRKEKNNPSLERKSLIRSTSSHGQGQENPSSSGGCGVDVTSEMKLEDQLSAINLNSDPTAQSQIVAGLPEKISEGKQDKQKKKRLEMTSHSAYLHLLCSQAPHYPPNPTSEPNVMVQPKVRASKSQSPKKVDSSIAVIRGVGRSGSGRSSSPEGSGFTSSASSSSPSSDTDSEDGDSYPSEVPLHLAQGDLYLKGPRPRHKEDHHENHEQNQDQDAGGSSEAIRHALGACAEAVDRVVWGAEFLEKMKSIDRPEVSHHNPSKLQYREIEKSVPNHGSLLLPSKLITSLELSLPPKSISNNAGSPEQNRISEPLPIPSTRSFVLTRPPGHHCGSGSSSSNSLNSSVPSGFCWVNNVMVAAAHAHLNHGIERIVILDVDLHHGNGTQSLAWRINEESLRQNLESNARKEASQWSSGDAEKAEAKDEQKDKRPLEIFYGSLHDIESYPCEDGNLDMIRDASTCIFGAHGQWIWNVHLESHDPDSSSSFQELYRTKYSILLSKAREFLSRKVGGGSSIDPSKNLIFLSTGFDSNQHEHPGMQRHNKFVPTSFFEEFTRDSVTLADECCQGKLISFLEGGYSDRTLISGGLSHLRGFMQAKEPMSAETQRDQREAAMTVDYWNVENLTLIEKFYKKFNSLALTNGAYLSQEETIKGLKISKALDSTHPWLKKTFETFYRLNKVILAGIPSEAESNLLVGAANTLSTPANGRSLRDRKNLKSPEKWAPDVSIGSNTASAHSSPKVSKKGRKSSSLASKSRAGGTPTVPSKSAVNLVGDRKTDGDDIPSKDIKNLSKIDERVVEDETVDLIDSLNSLSVEERK